MTHTLKPFSIPFAQTLLGAAVTLSLTLQATLGGTLPNAVAMDEDQTTQVKSSPDLLFHKIKVNKILILGNSITLHGPAPAIGWQGNWGMAASAKDNDYAHLVLKAITKVTGTPPQSLITNLATFERQFKTYAVDTSLKRELAFKPDLIILAIGENVPALTSKHMQVAFTTAMKKLLAKLQENGDPVIVVRSCFWHEPIRDGILKQTCKDAGGIFVDASALGKDEANYARSERKFSHDGVAAHPGDRGMRAIADLILKALTSSRQEP